MTPPDAGTPLVVVGVDGSDCSQDALRFAIEEARMRGASLHVVTAWSIPTNLYASGYASSVDADTFREAAEATSTHALERAHEIAPDLTVDAETPEEHAVTALLSAAEHADLLVVGSRGRGGFARLLLGSVSTQLAQHARCPVTIVRPIE
jgi:nucleotide-binding universal stress UspA family protein